MTAELIMPTLPPGDRHQQQAPQHHHHQNSSHRPQHHMRSISYQTPPGSQQISPLSTSNESQQQQQHQRHQRHNASVPPSPTATGPNARSRPLYMPAVLRPNSDFSQMLSCASSGATSGSGRCDDPVCEQSTGRRLSNGLMSVTGLSMIQQALSRRSTGDSGNDKKKLKGGWNLELFPQVTDLPTRKHWKPDPDATVCDDPTCKRTFNYFVRRHHCRRCGNIFCDPHSSFEVPLDQDANFNPRATTSRTCNHCFEQYRAWHTRNNSHASSSTASSDAPNTTPPTPISASSAAGGPRAALNLAKTPEVPNSVPRDWNWSTF